MKKPKKYPKSFVYGDKTFTPVVKLPDKERELSVASPFLRSDRELNLSTYVGTYTYDGFYDACSDKEWDLFLCEDNDKLYIPGLNELFEYTKKIRLCKTIGQVYALKNSWHDDPCWDIEDTEGFEEYKDILLAYRTECAAKWEAERLVREKQLNAEADKLGIVGLYRMILSHELILKRHRRAIELLTDGDSFGAYKVLTGMASIE